jgi:hypothetical protein
MKRERERGRGRGRGRERDERERERERVRGRNKDVFAAGNGKGTAVAAAANYNQDANASQCLSQTLAHPNDSLWYKVLIRVKMPKWHGIHVDLAFRARSAVRQKPFIARKRKVSNCQRREREKGKDDLAWNVTLHAAGQKILPKPDLSL